MPTLAGMAVAAFGQEGPYLVDEVSRIGELAVNAGKPHERHFVEIAQVLHHEFTEPAAFDFQIERHVHVVFNGGNGSLDVTVANRPLPAGAFQAVLDLVPRKGDPRAIAFHYLDGRFLDALVSRIASSTFQTLPPTAN